MQKASQIPAVSLLLRIVSSIVLVGMAAVHADESVTISLFNGETLHNWDGDPEFWSVKEGAITGVATVDKPLKTTTYLIWRGETFDDFKMTFEYRIDGGNSGVHFRSHEIAKWQVEGYQADISDWEDYTGVLYSSPRSQLAYRGESVAIDKSGKKTVTRFGDHDRLRKHIQEKQWNQYMVIARGPHIMLTINGVMMSQGIDRDREQAARTGIIAIQLHDGPPMKIQIRNMAMQKLD